MVRIVRKLIPSPDSIQNRSSKKYTTIGLRSSVMLTHVPYIRPSQTAAFLTFVILQSLAVADTTYFKRAVQTDTQTHRAYKWLQVPIFHLTVNVRNDKL